MPVYEYECLKCKKKFETTQRITDKPLEEHDCGGKVQRLISRSAFQLKGSGWYKTDYTDYNMNSASGQ